MHICTIYIRAYQSQNLNLKIFYVLIFILNSKGTNFGTSVHDPISISLFAIFSEAIPTELRYEEAY